ncbi:hypothetical protein AVEN_143837-1 [Araneus ventricosus]|uniref:Uncharacterized protein n=1 Tax=Araneus ventricosus TaxID=182803 RepID=A0A4Y2T9R5_ARAVE|nr:hypothetical protein AVEN_143837-1 [Araneus ventricosus]
MVGNGQVALYRHLQGRHILVPHCKRRLSAVNMNRFTNADLADILFMYDLTNTNGRLLYNYIGKNFLPDTYLIPKCSLMCIRTYQNMDSLQ